MALTDDQKAGVRRFLGYPDVNRLLAPDLEGALVALSAAAETQVGTILTDLGTIETTLRASWGRQKVHRAEDVTLAGHDEIIGLRREGNRLAEHLATILGVRVKRLPFQNSSSGIAGRG